MLDVVRVGVLHTTRNSCIGESPVIYQGAFRRRYQYQPDPGTSLGPLPAAYRGPVMHPASFVRPSPQHIEEAARHCSHAKTPPGESIGLRRSSTGSERVAGFGYRSPWWRVRGVQRPGVFEESLVPPAPGPRGTYYPHLSLGSRRAPAELAHMYRYRWIDRSGSLALDRCLFGKPASSGG